MARKVWIYSIDGAAPKALEGLQPGDMPLRWSADGKSVWILNSRSTPAQIFRLDVDNRRRIPGRQIAFADPAGLDPNYFRLWISADGRSYVYGYARSLEDLYLVDGLR
jgi:hypothetical protein